MNNLSPIVLFTYKRLETLQKTIQALSVNHLASESDLIIYSDGPKNLQENELIGRIRTYLKSIQGFKSVTIHQSKQNRGLATSIITGVSDTFKLYSKAIVLEDDLITSMNFLAFMNASLDRFKDSQEVYSISGYSFDFDKVPGNVDGYFLNRSWSWGWATWADRWHEIDWGMHDYSEFKRDKKRIAEFSKMGSDVNKMLYNQMNGTTDSWYIRSTFHQFKMKGLAFYPSISKVNNEGFDAVATHNKGLKARYITKFDISNRLDFIYPDRNEINLKMQQAFLDKMSFKNRIFNKILECLKN
jgi:hypothetical protein